ncbi:MAG: hypothetical protein N3H31_00650 [Candidatus Nezhaarchaeota archaeon]|nr:hypothetical protein [Candidatus Nezhaarchaeota archaeon]
MSQELVDLIKRRLEGLPHQAPLVPAWIEEVVPLLVSLGRKVDEALRRLDRLERAVEEVKQMLSSRGQRALKAARVKEQ